MNWFHLHWRNGDFSDLESASIYKKALAALSVPASFTFSYA